MEPTVAEAVEIPTTGSEPNDDADQTDDLEEAAAEAGRIGASDSEAFKHLFNTYFDRLYRYVFRYLESAEESQDVVHDVFLRVWRERRRIGLERDLRTYLYATARNHALNRIKHRKLDDRFRERRAAALATEESATLSPSPQSELEARERAAAIQHAVDTLPRRQRQVIELRWHSHLSYDEIASVLGLSPKTVANHVGRALQHLRAMLPGLME